METKNLKHYGKDILTIGKESSMPFTILVRVGWAVLRYLFSTMAALGPGGIIKLFRGVKEEIERTYTLDLSAVRARGILEDDLAEIIRKIAMAKVMAELLGMDKAAALRNALSNRISVYIFGEMFPTSAQLRQCGGGDFLPSFKDYYTAMMTAMETKGLEKFTISADNADNFQLDVTYCAWAEIAALMGNREYCYYSTCYGDEVFFPKFAEEAGFDFERKGTLALGYPVCDMRFTRKTA